jgi:hypothetical protein
MVTLVVWGIAILGGNIGALIPENVFAGLHSSRLAGASVNQLKTQVETLVSESNRLREENTVLLRRFMLTEQNSGDVTRRVSALELSIPKLLEAIPADNMIDRGTATASIGGTGTETVFDTEGGKVSVTKRPLPGTQAAIADTQPMPDALGQPIPDASAYGVALGPPFDRDEGESVWQAMNDRAGTLLAGKGALLASMEGIGGKRLVVGPITRENEANQLCGRFAKMGIACSVVPFIGVPLPLMN